MKRILIPTDFSENAYNALGYALQLFKEQHCSFYLLHTYMPATVFTASVYEGNTAVQLDVGKVQEQNSQDGLEKMLNWATENYPDQSHRIETISAYNMLQNQIKELASTFDFDLIVMGSKGATGAKKVFLGSNTVHTVKNAHCSVIVVPEEYRYKAPKHILFATDYKLNTENPGLKLLKELAEKHISSIALLNVTYHNSLSRDQVETKKYLDNHFKGLSHMFTSTAGQPLEEAIENFESKYPTELLCMVHNKHSFFQNLLFTPVIYNLIHKHSIPFLVLPSKKLYKS